MYGRNTPYGWQIEYEHLARIHREDLVNFYQRYYFPKNIMLAMYGDFSAAAMKDKLEKLFADLDRGTTPCAAVSPGDGQTRAGRLSG